MTRKLALLALALTLAACNPLPGLLGLGAPDGASGPVSSPDGNPFGAVGGHVSNNKASLSGVVLGPPALVSNNTAGYRTQAEADRPVPKAVVYLTAPDERFYGGDDGKAIFTITDDEGRYTFKAAPSDAPVIVTVLLAQNRRMVGFLIPKQGKNAYDVDLATTVVAEFLRDQARLAGRSMADYPALATELPTILTLTRELIASDKLQVSDLGVNAIPAMRHAYVRAFGADNKALSDAWKRLLGYRPLLIDEVETGLGAEYTTLSVHVAEDGSTYTAGVTNFNLEINRRKPDGSFETITSAPRVDWIDYVGGMLVKDGTLHVGAPSGELFAHYGFDLSVPFAGDKYANNTYFARSGFAADESVLPFHAFDLATKGDDFYASNDAGNEIVRYRIDPADPDLAYDDDGWQIAQEAEVVAGDRNAPAAFDPAQNNPVAGSAARFNYPTGITLRTVGGTDYLYVADTLNHRIRRINLASRQTETVLGTGDVAYGNTLKPPGALEDGKLAGSAAAGYPDIDSPDGVPASKVRLMFPHKVVFDASGSMFIADQDHRRVRMYDGTKVYTLAGTEAGAPSAIGDSRRAGLGEVASIAFDPDGNLLIADGRSSKLRRLWLKFGL